jgi:hypothetical protein
MQEKLSSVRLMVFVLGVVFVGGSSIGMPNVAYLPVFDPSDPPLRLTVLYDNYLYKEGTRADWGFS